VIAGDRFGHALRIVYVVHIAAVFAQAVYAGQFLSGEVSPVRLHEVGAWIILFAAAAQILLTILRGGLTAPALPLVLSSVGVLLCEGLQIGTGYGRFLEVHIPLAVLIFGGLVWQGFQLFRSPTRGSRPI
jgi:hypothetical protein